jgi:antitoxin YefM
LKQVTFKFSLAELLISSVHVHYNLYDMLYMLNNSFILLATTTDRQAKTMECHMRIISFSDARSSLRTVIDQVVEDADVTVISRHYSSLMETVHLLSSPANAAHLAKSIGQARAGQAQHRDIVNIPESEDLEHAQHKVHG